MKTIRILLCGLFVLMIFLLLVTSSNPQEFARIQFHLQSIPQAVGVFVSGVACLALLLKVIGGAQTEQVVPMIVPLFAGMLLIEVHWILALSLGLVVFGFVIQENLAAIYTRRDTST